MQCGHPLLLMLMLVILVLFIVVGVVGSAVIGVVGSDGGGTFQIQHGKAFVLSLTGSIVLHNLLKVTRRHFKVSLRLCYTSFSVSIMNSDKAVSYFLRANVKSG